MNPFGRSYIIAIAVEDFIDISNVGLSLKGFTFTKMVAIRTKVPIIEMHVEILNAMIGEHSVYQDYLKVCRSTEVSQKLALGGTMESIGFMNLDSEYSTMTLMKIFQDSVEEIPSIQDLNFGETIHFTSIDLVPVEYTIPSRKNNLSMECYPCRFA